jgi:hypothetical protein
MAYWRFFRNSSLALMQVIMRLLLLKEHSQFLGLPTVGTEARLPPCYKT